MQGAATTTIKYVGLAFEQVEKTGVATEYVHYVFAGERRIAVYTTDDAAAPAETTRYLHQDHLGSVDTITDETGAVVERLSYDAFGKRRTATGTDAWTDSVIAITPGNTPRGFTDHEHLDDFELVHMNGRVYDPVLGRFLSPDPFVQYPESTQGFNRYTYTSNNPLSFTDPSGYFLSEPDWDADYEVDDDEENGGSYGCDGCGYTGNDEDELYGYDPWDDTPVRPGDTRITNTGTGQKVSSASGSGGGVTIVPDYDSWEKEHRLPTTETIRAEMNDLLLAGDMRRVQDYAEILGIEGGAWEQVKGLWDAVKKGHSVEIGAGWGYHIKELKFGPFKIGGGFVVASGGLNRDYRGTAIWGKSTADLQFSYYNFGGRLYGWDADFNHRDGVKNMNIFGWEAPSWDLSIGISGTIAPYSFGIEYDLKPIRDYFTGK